MTHVLFVSDDETEIDSIRDILTHMGFDVYVADTLEEVGLMCRMRQLNLVIADIEMDAGAGFEAIAIVSRTTDTSPVIAVTRGAHEDLWPMVSFACGADAYMVGPLTHPKLEDTLARNGMPQSLN